MERVFYVAGNWKMNLLVNEGLALSREVLQGWNEMERKVRLLFFTPYPHLAAVAALTEGVVEVGAQDCSAQPHGGAFTGEVSSHMVASAGASWVLVGHSERRQYHGEEGALLVQKMQRAVEAGLRVIYCCGEPLIVREKGDEAAVEYVLNQLQLLRGENKEPLVKVGQLLVAYEPIWAIGTGRTATPEQAGAMCEAIDGWCQREFGVFRYDIPVLYGGSCNAKNAGALFAQPAISGGLIGGASLRAADFLSIAQEAQKTVKSELA